MRPAQRRPGALTAGNAQSDEGADGRAQLGPLVVVEVRNAQHRHLVVLAHDEHGIDDPDLTDVAQASELIGDATFEQIVVRESDHEGLDWSDAHRVFLLLRSRRRGAAHSRMDDPVDGRIIQIGRLRLEDGAWHHADRLRQPAAGDAGIGSVDDRACPCVVSSIARWSAGPSLTSWTGATATGLGQRSPPSRTRRSARRGSRRRAAQWSSRTVEDTRQSGDDVLDVEATDQRDHVAADGRDRVRRGRSRQSGQTCR